MKTIIASQEGIKIISFREEPEALILHSEYLAYGFEVTEREMIKRENEYED